MLFRSIYANLHIRADDNSEINGNIIQDDRFCTDSSNILDGWVKYDTLSWVKKSDLVEEETTNKIALNLVDII